MVKTRRRRFRFVERTWKRHSNCLSGYASRRIAQRSDETDSLAPGDHVPDGKTRPELF